MRRTKWCQEGIYVLIALALLAGIPFMPLAAASPDQATFFSRASDGYLRESDLNYSDVHGASSGIVHNTTQLLWVGQHLVEETLFEIYRGAVFFDTSRLPDDACISSAVLSLYGYTDRAVEFEITVVDGSGLHEPLVGTDYAYLGSQNVSGGAFNTRGFIIDAYNDIPLNGTGMGWISKSGITKLGLRSSREIAAIAPTIVDFHQYVEVYASEAGEGKQPRLVVTYTIPPPVGGEVYPVNKVPLLAPWIAVAIVLAGGLMWYALRRRRAQS